MGKTDFPVETPRRGGFGEPALPRRFVTHFRKSQ